MDVVNELKSAIRGDVAYDSETRDAYSRDASLFKVTPQVVVFPKDARDIENLVLLASARKKGGEDVSLTARSGGTDMSGGALSESIVVEFGKYFNRVKEIAADGRAVAEPGVFYRDFEKAASAKGFFLPSYPASKDICALGGIVANNSGGEKSLAYGKTERYVVELKAVLADGKEYVIRPLTEAELKEKMKGKGFEAQLYKKIFTLIDQNYDLLKKAKPRVTKNSAGYYLWNVWDRERNIFDLTKLFVGSQGTLGIITEVTFQLLHPKKHSRLLVLFLRDLSKLGALSREVASFTPESFESYDDKTLKLVFSYFAGFMKILGVKNILKLAWSFLPEARMVVTGGFPRLVLLAEFTGDDEREVEARALRAKAAAKKIGVRVHLARDEFEARKYWTIRREAFNLLRSHLKKKRSVPFIDDLVVLPEKLPLLLSRLYEILKPYEDRMTTAIGGHVGDGNIHIYSILDLEDPRIPALIPEVSEKVYNLALELGGSITAEHNDGLIRGSYLEKMYGSEVFALFQEVKHLFDPLGIFNPGKKTEADQGYALAHMRHS